jgi:uncharacterized membrane protein YjgN (DUF898 family)
VKIYAVSGKGIYFACSTFGVYFAWTRIQFLNYTFSKTTLDGKSYAFHGTAIPIFKAHFYQLKNSMDTLSGRLHQILTVRFGSRQNISDRKLWVGY